MIISYRNINNYLLPILKSFTLSALELLRKVMTGLWFENAAQWDTVGSCAQIFHRQVLMRNSKFAEEIALERN